MYLSIIYKCETAVELEAESRGHQLVVIMLLVVGEGIFEKEEVEV